jgi:transposase
MLYVGIDVAKNKHECFMMDSDGVVHADGFSFANTRDGFDGLLAEIRKAQPRPDGSNTRIGLEATGHYSANLLRFLCEKELNPVLLNPMSANSYRKAMTLRKTKTDKTDARLIATMLISGDLKPYSPPEYHIAELKSLTRSRFRLVGERSKLKTRLVRILDTVFPELASAVWMPHQKSMLAMLEEFPSAADVAAAHLTKLAAILSKASHGKYGKDKAILIRGIARKSIGSPSSAAAFELRQTIRHIRFLQSEIDAATAEIKRVMDGINSPLCSVPGISHVLAATILAEMGDIRLFESPSKLLAFAGLEPSTYQSGQYSASHVRMVKRGSKYLRWALLTAARPVCMRDPAFKGFYAKKKSEGKHHYVALSHAARKLVRVLCRLLRTGEAFAARTV